MKKVLLATTVLALSATVAAAQNVTISGNARMGVTYNDENANEMAFTSRARVNFSMSGDTESGLSFGASFNVHDSDGANDGTAGSVFVSGAFGRLTMGDVAGAAEMAVGDLHGVGMTGLGDFHENIYLSNARRPAARYEYSTGGLTFAISADNPGLDGDDVEYSFYGGLVEFEVPTENTYAVGVRYSVDSYAFGIGYEKSTIDGVGVDHWIVGAEGTFSGVTVRATYGKADLGFGDNLAQYGLSAAYTADALTVTGFYRVEDFNFAVENFKAYGVGASYALGGGASVVGGVSKNRVDGLPGNTRADLGLTFSF